MAVTAPSKIKVPENDGGEPGGTRTRDPMIKSHVLYRLSYGLGPRVCTGGLVRGQ
jgi:hypothetical protein